MQATKEEGRPSDQCRWRPSLLCYKPEGLKWLVLHEGFHSLIASQT